MPMKPTPIKRVILSLLPVLFGLSGSSLRADYPAGVLADGPTAYWRLNETSGPLALDALGLHPGGYSNTVTFGVPGALVGDPDPAVYFDGTTGTKVDVPYAPALNPSIFTIECWANVTGGGSYRSPLTARADSPTRGYMFYATPANTWEFWTGTGGAAGTWNMMTGPAVIYNQWTHLVGTYDGTTKRFYINGALVHSIVVPFRANSVSPLRIGGGASDSVVGSFFFVGDVDEVAVYDKVLTLEQIQAHYYTAQPTPPTIVTQPQSTNAYEGSTVTLSVGVVGTPPLSYQWYLWDFTLVNQTNRTLVLHDVTDFDSGPYYVEITNPAGGPVTSDTADVTVLPTEPPTITTDPQSASVYQGGTVRFKVTATGGTQLTYQWQHDGGDLLDATNALLVVSNVTPSEAGGYQVWVGNALGLTPSAQATLTVIVPDPGSYAATVLEDQPAAYWRLDESGGPLALDALGSYDGGYSNTVTLGVAGALVGDLDTAVHFDGVAGTKVDVAYSPALNPASRWSVEAWARVTGGDGSYRSPITSRDDQPQRGFIFYATAGNTWEFWSGQGSQNGWDPIVGPPVVNNAWTHLAATYDGATKRFYVNGVLVGTSTLPYGPNTARPLRLGGGSTDSILGNYFFVGDVDEVAVYNSVLTPERVGDHFAASLGGGIPPSILSEPVSRTVLPGDPVTFSVATAGSLPRTYQWQFQGQDLDSQTNSELGLTNVSSSMAGDYQLIVQNLAGKATSAVATLTVVAVPNLPYNTAVLADSPVAYWRLGELSGTVAADETGNHPGQYMNNVALGLPGAIPGDPNPAAGFATAPQTKVEVPFSADLNPPQFSVEVWAKVTGGSGSYRSPVASRDDLPQRGYIFYADYLDTWQFWSGMGTQNGWDVIVGPPVQLGVWTYLVATYDGAIRRFYVNGVQVGVSTNSFGQNTAQLLRIGGSVTENPVGDFFFEGAVDEVAVYNTALSPAAVLTHFALGTRPTLQLSASESGLTLTWTSGRGLEMADDLGGPWVTVPNATSPFPIAATDFRKFYRLLR